MLRLKLNDYVQIFGTNDLKRLLSQYGVERLDAEASAAPGSETKTHSSAEAAPFSRRVGGLGLRGFCDGDLHFGFVGHG